MPGFLATQLPDEDLEPVTAMIVGNLIKLAATGVDVQLANGVTTYIARGFIREPHEGPIMGHSEAMEQVINELSRLTPVIEGGCIEGAPHNMLRFVPNDDADIERIELLTQLVDVANQTGREILMPFAGIATTENFVVHPGDDPHKANTHYCERAKELLNNE